MAVQFDEDQQIIPQTSRSSGRGLLGFFVQIGLAKNRNQAQYVLLIIIVVAIIVTIYLLSQTGELSVPVSTPSAT